MPLYACYNSQAMKISTKRRKADRAEVTISSKRQITIPAAMARELAIEPGDKLLVRIRDGTLELRRRPESITDLVSGTLGGLYGRTKEEVDAYIREVREGWDERARRSEGETYRGERT